MNPQDDVAGAVTPPSGAAAPPAGSGTPMPLAPLSAAFSITAGGVTYQLALVINISASVTGVSFNAGSVTVTADSNEPV